MFLYKRRKICTALFMGCLAFSSQTKLFASIVVVIYTPDGYWVGADGIRSDSTARIQRVCKIHETKFGLIAKGGNAEGIAQDGVRYSTDKEVEDLLSTSISFTTFVEDLRVRFKSDIERELVFRAVNPQVNIGNLETWPMTMPISSETIRSMDREILAFNAEFAPDGIILQVKPKSDIIGKDSAGHPLYRYWGPSILGNPIPKLGNDIATEKGKFTNPESVKMFIDPFPYPKSNEWIRAHPYEAMKDILASAHRSSPSNIGPPYTIVQVTKTLDHKLSFRWIEKGACPSWTARVLSR